MKRLLFLLFLAIYFNIYGDVHVGFFITNGDNFKSRYLFGKIYDKLEAIDSVHFLTKKDSSIVNSYYWKRNNSFLAGDEFRRYLYKTKDIRKNIYLVFVNCKFKREVLRLDIEVYSQTKRRIIFKKRYLERPKTLKNMFEAISRDLISGMSVIVDPQISSVPENFFSRYLKIENLLHKKQFLEAFDKIAILRESYKDDFLDSIYSNLEHNNRLWESLSAKMGVFSRKITVFSENTELQNMLRDIYEKGTEADIGQIVESKGENEGEVDILVPVTFKLERRGFNRLIKEIKSQKGDLNFIKMDRILFSKDESISKQFQDMLLNQKLRLVAYDAYGQEIFTSDKSLSISLFDKGGYKGSKHPPFLIMPRGMAESYFYYRKQTEVVFDIKDIPQKDFYRVSKTKVFIDISEQ